MKNSTKVTAALFGLLLGIGAIWKAEKKEKEYSELAQRNASWINQSQQQQNEIFDIQRRQSEEFQRQHQEMVLNQALENVRLMNNL